MESFFTKLIADYLVVLIALVGAYALLRYVPKGSRYRAYCRVLMAGLTAYLLAKLAATVYQPQLHRPYELLGIAPGASYLDNPGFPSDHALFVTAIVLAVWFETRKKVLSAVLAACAVVVCVGRVVALVHTPLDVAAGVAIAMVGALWYLQATPARRLAKRIRKVVHT